MQPSLWEGDEVIVDLNARSIAPGDIALFGNVLHRVWWIDPAGRVWETGDFGTGFKRRPMSDVRGRLVSVQRAGAFVDIPSFQGSPWFLTKQFTTWATRRLRRTTQPSSANVRMSATPAVSLQHDGDEQ